MSQRIGDQVVEYIIASPDLYSRTLANMALDLRDARTRIAELERLSASQSEAMDMMDRGSL